MASPGYGPLWRINGPPPSPPTTGLLNVARVVDDVDAGGIERWLNGVEVYAYPVDVAHAWDACATGSDRVNKGSGADFPHPQFGAITLYVAETCSSLAVFGPSDPNPEDLFKARAAAVMGAVASAGVAAEFISGDVMLLNPHLSDGNGTFPWGDSATSIANGVALLEDEIGKSGRSGIIHCSPAMATAMKAEHILVDDRKLPLQTVMGTLVAADGGYIGAPSPKLHADPSSITQEWVYATSPVEIRRSEVFTQPESLWMALDRAANSITYRAEQYFLVDWDTSVQAAVLIDRCASTCGTPPS